MIRSMTGYGSATLSDPRVEANVAVRSLNHRYLDLSLHVPRGLSPLEPEIKELVQSRLGRGRVDVSLQATLVVDAESFRIVPRPSTPALVRALRQLREEHALAGDVDVATVARMGAIDVVEVAPAVDDTTRQALIGLVDQALEGVVAMRRAEGATLTAELTERLAAVEAAAAAIESLQEATRIQRTEALREKLKGLVGEMGLDENRLYQEVVRVVDRQDTSEEIQRLRSHVAMARTLVGSTEPAGKRLDFLAQELAREANTIGSKASSAEVVQKVVNLKAEIEKLREQVQNVE